MSEERMTKKQRRSDNVLLLNDWPPPFEISGASYVFDARSGLFYEGSSNFFYDPKTKLYFSNKEQKYYQLSPDGKNSFHEVSQVECPKGVLTSKASPTCTVRRYIPIGLSENNIKNSTCIKKPDKRKIEISLKKKCFDTKFSSNTSTPSSSQGICNSEEIHVHNDPPAVLKVHKEHHADMEKWSQRGREILEVDEFKGPNEVYSHLESANELLKEDPNENKSIKLTIKGRPICVLCKRKFENIEKLMHHEQFSVMHKHNLIKKKALTHSVLEYRDRAKERRTMYGPDQQTINCTNACEHDYGRNESQSDTFTERKVNNKCIEDGNIGNKLLQKLGWKGGALGRTSGKSKDILSFGTERSITSTKLKQDWDHIEFLANKSV